MSNPDHLRFVTLILTTHGSLLYEVYGMALARVGTDDIEARKVLSRVVADMGTVGNFDSGGIIVVRAKLYLSRIQRRLGENDAASRL